MPLQAADDDGSIRACAGASMNESFIVVGWRQPAIFCMHVGCRLGRGRPGTRRRLETHSVGEHILRRDLERAALASDVINV